MPISVVINYIKSEFEVTSQVFNFSQVGSTAREVVWTPPLGNIIKVNVDGSSLGNHGPAGFGGLIRNNAGEWICGFSGSCGYADNLTAEVHAIKHGVELAWDKGFKDVILESDSKCVLDLLTTPNNLHSLFPLLAHITSLLDRSWNVKLQHSHREGNECANWLAKTGATAGSAWEFWEQCPHQLDPILLADALLFCCSLPFFLIKKNDEIDKIMVFSFNYIFPLRIKYNNCIINIILLFYLS